MLHAPIQMSLLEINLSSCPDYECLSYTWGSDDTALAASSAVDVDGKTVMIRINLFNALCRLRLVDRERLLWVDALSINQTDLEEKARQVAMIGKVFQQSVRVLAWVGEHSDDSELVFTLSDELQDLKVQTYLEARHFGGRDDIICAWSSFLDRRYFHRVWTFQEVVCARDVLVCCGPDDKDWGDLISMRFQYRAPMSNSRDLDNSNVAGESSRPSRNRKGFTHEDGDRWISNTRAVKSMDLARSTYAYGGTLLIHCIEELRRRECSDPRDRVYAVLSLARDDSVAASVGTDYKISMPDLCYKVVMVIPRDNTVADGTLSALLRSLGCDHNEAGCFVDLMLDRPENAIVNKWDVNVEYLIRDRFLIDHTRPRSSGYPEVRARRSNLLSWRTAARERGSWPQTPGKGVYPPFRR